MKRRDFGWAALATAFAAPALAKAAANEEQKRIVIAEQGDTSIVVDDEGITMKAGDSTLVLHHTKLVEKKLPSNIPTNADLHFMNDGLPTVTIKKEK